MNKKCTICLNQYKPFDSKDDGICFKCLSVIDDFGSDIVKLKRAILYLKCSEPEPINDSIVHGVDCDKVKHTADGCLHGDHNDAPYDVDNMKYCGRCHHALIMLQNR